MIKSDKISGANLDWENLPFDYMKTDYRFTAKYRNGEWDAGGLTEDENIYLHESSTSLHYAQQCFEGLKAYVSQEGKILLFRPFLNAERMARTAQRLFMPPPSEELFIRGIKETIRANLSWVPPYGTGASLYIRPLLFGTGPNLGLRTAPEFTFRIFISPVGPYYRSGNIKPITLLVTDKDRVAPNGIGSYKAGANYASGLMSSSEAKEKGANDVVYLDSKENKYFDEAGTSNVIFYMNDKTFITPKSEAILPSITRRSIMHLASEELGLKTDERQIEIDQEIKNINEMGACGTAVVISPVGGVIYKGITHKFYDQGQSVGPIMKKLYTLLTEIQRGERKDKYNWIETV